ncbi:hypothetical protein Tco_0035604 [Tanacetum coccineum]
MNLLSESFTARIKEQVKDLLPQILPQEVFNFASPVIEKLFHETRYEVTLAKASSQPQSTYKAASTLTDFELKKILLDKIKISESYLTALEHRECYDGLKKSYALDQDFFYSYDVYTLKRDRKDKDKDEDPSVRSDRGLKRRKTSKDTDPTTEQLYMIYLALKTWFQTYGALLRLLMINMRYGAYHIRENNVSPSMPMQEIQEGDDVADFAIALRMFTRSLVIQKKWHPYTPYKDPQGFIYVDDFKRNRLMRFDELYKFSDGTLTRLLSSLKDITKNIDMEYLPKRR